MEQVLENRKIWEIGERTKDDIIDQILSNRNITKENGESFLNPDFDNGLYDPFLMLGMNEAVERIALAIEKKEKVGIFGDYDADGIPATALLYDVLEKAGLEVLTFIPKRSEGYGLSEKGINYFLDNKVGLIITVDLGITGKSEVDFARKKGIDVIVTDHHEPIQEYLPEAAAVIDPKQKKCKYPFKELSGTGVAFKLAQALTKKTGLMKEDQLKWYLDLVAISTFCDIVPLIDENRVLAKFGLIVLQKTRRLGLRKMYEMAGINNKEVSAYTVGFMIGPRLNAPGRMGDCSNSLKLLLSKDEKEAEDIAKELELANTRRQDILRKTMKEADQKVDEKKLFENKVILVSGEGWSEGVVGLVAGRLTEKYTRPVLVIGFQDGVGVGSARSIDGFNMVKSLNNCKKYLIKHGGHTKAAGLTIKMDDLEKFYEAILGLADGCLKQSDLVGKIKCEMEINFSEISLSLIEKIEKLEPFGLGNLKPVFYSKEIICKDKKLMGKNKDHLKLVLESNGNLLEALMFGQGGLNKTIRIGDELEIAYSLDKNEWQGNSRVQLKLVDLKVNDDLAREDEK